MREQKTAGVLFLGQRVLLFDNATNQDLGTFPMMARKPSGKPRPTLRQVLEAHCAAIGYALKTEMIR